MRSRTIECDMCHATADLTNHGGKPKGWAVLSFSAKTHDPGTGHHPQRVQRLDLCPDCAEKTHTWLEEQTWGKEL